MTGEHDHIVLSTSERERLAAIEATLAGTDPAFVERVGRLARVSPRRRLWLAGLLATLGTALIVATFTRWLWVAIAGAGLITAGGLVGADPLAARVVAAIDRRRHLPRGPGEPAG